MYLSTTPTIQNIEDLEQSLEKKTDQQKSDILHENKTRFPQLIRNFADFKRIYNILGPESKVVFGSYIYLTNSNILITEMKSYQDLRLALSVPGTYDYNKLREILEHANNFECIKTFKDSKNLFASINSETWLTKFLFSKNWFPEKIIFAKIDEVLEFMQAFSLSSSYLFAVLKNSCLRDITNTWDDFREISEKIIELIPAPATAWALHRFIKTLGEEWLIDNIKKATDVNSTILDLDEVYKLFTDNPELQKALRKELITEWQAPQTAVALLLNRVGFNKPDGNASGAATATDDTDASAELNQTYVAKTK